MNTRARRVVDALERLAWPHGIRCLWFCPPWHRPGAYPSWGSHAFGACLPGCPWCVLESRGGADAAQQDRQGPRGTIDPTND